MKRILGLAGALALGGAGVLLAPAGTAFAAGGCHPELPGVYRSVENGVPTYKEDARCGNTNSPPRPRAPQPRPQPQPTCHDVMVGGQSIGEICGEGLRPNPYNFGGRVTVIGYSGGFGYSGGSGHTGTVKVGEPETVETDTE